MASRRRAARAAQRAGAGSRSTARRVARLRARRRHRRRLRAALPLSRCPSSRSRAARVAAGTRADAQARRGARLVVRPRFFPDRRVVGLREPARFRRDAAAARGARDAALLRVSRAFPGGSRATVTRALRAPRVGQARCCSLPALWTLTEWMRGWIFTGFPVARDRLLAGADEPARGLRAGPRRLRRHRSRPSRARACSRCSLNARARPRRARERNAVRAALAHPALAALVALWLGGYALQHVSGPSPRASRSRWRCSRATSRRRSSGPSEGLRATLGTYHRLALASDAKLIVLPGDRAAAFPARRPADYLGSLADHARRNGGDMLIGVPERLPSGDYYNSVISLGASPTQAYRKTHLVPFGEFIPLRPVLGWIVGVLAIPLQDFSRGAPDPKPLAVAGQRVAVEHLLRGRVRRGDHPPASARRRCSST